MRGGVVYVADAEGLVQAIDAKTGAVVVAVELDVPASGGPGVWPRASVLIGTSDAVSSHWQSNLAAERWARKGVQRGVVRPGGGQWRRHCAVPLASCSASEVTTGERWRYERRCRY